MALMLPLTAQQWAVYVRHHIAGTYTMRTSVQILDLEHRVISDVSHLFVDGYVEGEEVKADEEEPDDLLEEVGVQQSANITLQDPGRSIALDSRSPSDAAIYLDRMIRVTVSTYSPAVPELGWVHCPQFTGPVTKLERDGIVVQLEAQSKERLALGNSNANRTFGGTKVAAAKNILTTFGEAPQYIDFGADPAKLPEAIQFKRETRPWTKVWRTAQSMSKTAFYDARGVARMVSQSQIPAWTLDGTMITSVPQVSYDTADFANAVRVRGKATAGSKSMIDLTEYLPADNPNSAVRLGRRGARRDEVEFLFPSDLRNTADGLKLAKKELADRAATVVEAPLDCRPIWPLETLDLLDVRTDDFIGQTRARKWRRPLTCKGDMSIGYLANVIRPSAAAIRKA